MAKNTYPTYDVTLKKPETQIPPNFFSVLTRRLAESFEDSSLAQLPGE